MPRGKKSIGNKKNASNAGNGVMDVIKELWQAAVTLRGSIEPADYKRYVLPIIFLRFLSLRYERRREEIGLLLKDPSSEYYGDTRALGEPDEYRSVGAFILPEEARWENIVRHAQADDIKVRLDNILELLERSYPDKLRGLLPRIYAGSNLARESVTGLINLFSKDAFRRDYSGEDLIGRVYEYFIGEFPSSEGKRGGEYFTPSSIVRTLVAMLEPDHGIVFDPCCGSGGMFVQSDKFTKHSRQLSFVGQENKEFTYRLCRMNLFIHGIDGNIARATRIPTTSTRPSRPTSSSPILLSTMARRGKTGGGPTRSRTKIHASPSRRGRRCPLLSGTRTRCGSCTSSTI